jgi:hypothetical protein
MTDMKIIASVLIAPDGHPVGRRWPRTPPSRSPRRPIAANCVLHWYPVME